MTIKKVYARKISSEEASQGYILVLKTKLSFFPPIGKPFIIRQDHQERKVKVESYSCTCQGPDNPHEHYFIKWKGLQKKQLVEIERDSDKPGRYDLKVQR